MDKRNTKVGRPSHYKLEYCDQLVKHMSKGYSFETFARKIKKSKQTLYTWSKQHPEFLDAKKKGETYCKYFWEDIGIKGMKGEIKNFNAVLWIVNMKNRFGWCNTPVQNDEPIDLKPQKKRLLDDYI